MTTTWMCSLIKETPSGDFLLTTLAAFTVIFFIIRIMVESFKNSQSPMAILMYEFYGQNPTHAYLIDLLFVLTYFATALAVSQLEWGQDWELTASARFFLSLAVVIAVLNFLVKFIVDASAGNSPNSHYIQFFKRWSDTMGLGAILWDWVYLGVIALLCLLILSSGLHQWCWVIAIFWAMVTMYFLTISEQ